MTRRTPDQQVAYERARARRLLTTYDLTLVEYDLIKDEQGGVCAICERAKGISAPLQVDHDHDVEEVRASLRGLLCGRDNNRLGWFEARRENVLRYLADPPAQRVLR